MYEFNPFKKTDELSYESFIQFPRELLNREEIQEKMHIKRSALDTTLAQLKECNLIKKSKAKICQILFI